MKTYSLLLIVVIMLTGCFNVDQAIYDGSPAALNITLKRDIVAVANLEEEQHEQVYVRVQKNNESGDVIYSILRTVLLSEVEAGYTLSEVVPAGKNYNVSAIYAGQGVIESAETVVDVAAEKSVTTTLTLSDLDYIFAVPGEVYSGGTVRQFNVEFLELVDELKWRVYLATAPWAENGAKKLDIPDGGSAWKVIVAESSNYKFKEVTEPIKLYYQLLIYDGYISGYFPDLETGKELPYIWLYPSPDWELEK